MKTLLKSTRWLNLYETDGWVFASRRKPTDPERTDAVNIIAQHCDSLGRKRLVVIEEFRVPIQSWEFSLPAGLVDGNEYPSEAAQRELKEETGFDVTQWLGDSGRLFSSAGLTDESIEFVVVECAGEPARTPGIDGEKIKVHLLDRAGCKALLERNHRSQAVVSVRLWPILASIAYSGSFLNIKID